MTAKGEETETVRDMITAMLRMPEGSRPEIDVVLKHATLQSSIVLGIETTGSECFFTEWLVLKMRRGKNLRMQRARLHDVTEIRGFSACSTHEFEEI